MSIHIAAQQGEIADKILLPGDPLRAKFIAENFLEDAVCFNEVRNMFGYTGTYKGHRVSVMGTGMGMPSISIYARELIVDYGVKKLIRVGTAGSLNEDVHVRELVIFLQDEIEDMLRTYHWELNTPTLRDNVRAKALTILQLVKANGGLYEYSVVCDETNNTPDIIDNEMLILDIEIEPARGAGKMVQTLTIHKTGGISSKK